VSFDAITLRVASQRMFISLWTQSGNFWIHPRNILLCMPTSSGLFLPIRFSDQTFYAFLISPMRVTCSAYLILLDLIILIICGKAYKLRSSSLCSLLQPSATSSLLGSNILFSSQFSNILNILPLVWETKFYTRTKQEVKLFFCVF
jgi:hypothetical protein